MRTLPVTAGKEEINEDSIKRLVDHNGNHLVSSKLGDCPHYGGKSSNEQ